MYIVTPQEMNQVDNSMSTEFGVPTLLLMENAANAVATYITDNYNDAKRIVFVTGSGNNGGDGWAAARILFARGKNVIIISTCNEDKMSELTHTNYLMAKSLGIPYILDAHENDLITALYKSDVAVDALLGTGIHGEVTGKAAQFIQILNECRLPIVSVDVPSGIDALNGSLCGIAVKAYATVVLGTYKIGQLLLPAREYCGKMHVDTISIPGNVFERFSNSRQMLTNSDIAKLLKQRAESSHKGTFGKLGIIAGSVGMTGAACLCAMSAQRSGTGIVQLAVPESTNSIFEVKLTEQMSQPMPKNQYGALICSNELIEFSNGKSALVIGPGLSRASAGRDFIPEILKNFSGITVIDADGLNCICRTPEVLSWGNCIITPHIGEMSRLTGLSVEEISNNMESVALDFAKKYNVCVVLKNYVTVIASPDGRIVYNVTGNSGMAKGGSGDVLSGIIGSLCAQGYSAFDAAAIGAYINGLSADIAATKMSKVSLMPTDTVDHISDAFLQIYGK